MDERARHLTIERAREHLMRASYPRAIELLRSALTLDPDDADAHALLALALHGARRLHAAELEAARAIECDPESALAHLAIAHVHASARRWEEARRHAETAAALAPDDSLARTDVATILASIGDLETAREHVAHALELAPGDPSVRAVAGWNARARNEPVEALEHAEAALRADPGHESALVLRGWLHLDRGETEKAREHALWALREVPNERRALALLVGTKMRTSWILGVWWRFNSAVMAGSRGRTVAWLVGLFLVKRLAELALRDLGLAGAAELVTWGWLAFCVYTWVGPAMFQRALQRELETVQLDPDF